MKKLLYMLIIVFCMNLLSCEGDNSAEYNKQTAKDDVVQNVTDDIGESETVGKKNENAFDLKAIADYVTEPFLSALEAKVPIIIGEPLNTVYITDLKFPQSKKEIFADSQLAFSYIDMDSDGIDELIIMSGYGDILVLKNRGSGIFGKIFGFREAECIYSDGTFSWSRTDSNAFCYGRSRLEFTDGDYRVIELFYTRCDKATGKTSYYIENEPTDPYLLSQYEGQLFSNKQADFHWINCELKSNEPVFAHTSDSVTIEYAPRQQECFPVTFMYQGQTVTVDQPVFTGIATDSVYSNETHLAFENGVTVFRVSLEDGCKSFLVDKSGNTVDSNYLGGSHISDIVAIHTRGDFHIKTTGTPMNYKQQLFNVNGDAVSDIFDGIGYFYNGIAPVEKNGKIGFIDDSGRTILEPCIQHDDLRYPPDYKGYWDYYLCEDAIVLPIDGEFAIINLTRE